MMEIDLMHLSDVAHVMRDFTLIIPTHNRAQLLAALLSYLEAENADCRILVLDSSRAEVKAANQARLRASSLDIEFMQFMDETIVEKWRQGIQNVATPFCALCADDDLVVLDGVQRCLDVLRGNPGAAVAQGFSFTFLPQPDGDLELNNIVYFNPSINDSAPLDRLARLFERYQAPTYGVFRTPILQRIFDSLQSLTSVLSRELLWSALTVIEGQAIRLPCFTYGRSMGPSAAYEHWHPLEWLCKDPEGLFAEYLRYRELLAAAVIRRSDNHKPADEVNSMLDLIHMRYLIKHAPDSALKFLTGQQMAGNDFAAYWPHHQIHSPLYAMAGVRASEGAEALGPRRLQGRNRSYLIFPQFFSPQESEPPQLSHVIGLTDTLDHYRPARGGVSN
jgi:glycosyltransferase domain-containing protein